MLNLIISYPIDASYVEKYQLINKKLNLHNRDFIAQVAKITWLLI
jgi:hypothetical protein